MIGLFSPITIVKGSSTIIKDSWGLGRAAVCDCGTPWTFLLLFSITLNVKNTT